MSASSEARLAAALGMVAWAAIPVAGGLASLTAQVTLLPALYVAVPVAVLAGLAAVAAYRRARAQVERSVRRAGERAVGFARLPALGGLYVAVTGALALGFYGLLHLVA